MDVWLTDSPAEIDPLGAATQRASEALQTAWDGLRRGLAAGDPAELWAHSQTLLEGAQMLHATLTRECGQLGPALAAVQRGEGESARQMLLDALTLSEQTDAVTAVNARYGLAWIALGEENPGAVRRHARALAADRSESFGWQAQWLLMWAELLDGDLRESRARARALTRIGIELGNPRAMALARAGLGRIALAEGDRSRADTLLSEALEQLQERPWLTDQVDTLEMLAVVMGAGGRSQRAVETLAAVARWRSDRGLVRVPARTDVFGSVIADARGALGADEFELAWAQGRERSLEAAIEQAQRRSGRERPASGWRSLTPAEYQVATLAAAGLSNPQIGARLFITRGTAKVHLSSVYRKLGVTNRTELAVLWGTRAAEPALIGLP